MIGGITEIPPMSSTVNSIRDAELSESGLGIADGPDSGARGRGLWGVTKDVFSSRQEHFEWLAERILSKCEFSIDFRLCFSDWAELDKTFSEKTSVQWGGRALPKESNETF